MGEMVEIDHDTIHRLADTGQLVDGDVEARAADVEIRSVELSTLCRFLPDPPRQLCIESLHQAGQVPSADVMLEQIFERALEDALDQHFLHVRRSAERARACL